MLEHVEYLCNPGGGIANPGSVQLLKTSPREGAEHILRGGLCQDLHGDGVIQFVSQSVLESRLVMNEIVLSRRAEQNRSIDFIYVRYRHPLPALHECVFSEPGKEGLYVMRYTHAELVVHRLANSVFNLEVLEVSTSGKSIEALDAGFPAPRAESEGIKIVDPVGDAQPPYKWSKADAAGYDDGRGTIAELLKRTAQPTQKLVDLLVSVVVTEHSFQEDGQLINDKQDRLIVFGTVTNQLFTESSPVSLIQSGPETDSELPWTNFIYSLRKSL